MAKKSVAEILEAAADVIETRGKCNDDMYNPTHDKFCAIGAIARATYSKKQVPDRYIETIAWIRPEELPVRTREQQEIYDPRFTDALHFAAEEARTRCADSAKATSDHPAVYLYNDRETITARHVAQMLRAAAKRAREAKAKS